MAQRGVVERSTLNIEYSTIHAPISGRIDHSLVPTGSQVSPNVAQPLASISSLDPIGVRFTVGVVLFLSLIGNKNGSERELHELELIVAGDTVFPHSCGASNRLSAG